MKKSIFAIVVFAVIGIFIPTVFTQTKPKSEFFEGIKKKPSGMAKLRAQFYYKQRTFPFGFIPPDWRLKAFEHMRKHAVIRPQALEPVAPIGPASIANGGTFGERQNLSGRITALALDPGNPSIVYLGAAQGGVWKSNNAGQSWSPLTDNAPTQATGALAVDPTDRNIIYVGTGEGNFTADSFFGMGILKSTDAGATWANLAADVFVGRSFNQLIIDPRRTSTVYAAIGFGIGGILGSAPNPILARNGIYKSVDGGETWTNVLKAGPSDLGSTAFDLEMDPNNSSILYATINGLGIFKTTDGGSNWNRLTGGLPTSNLGRPEIAVSKSNPNILYADFENASSGDLLNLFKSTDGGASWRSFPRPPASRFGNVCQCFYDNFIEIDPTNPDTVYFGGVALYKSTDGGMSWTDISIRNRGLHADFHSMVFAPNDPKTFYVGNDGGVWLTADGGDNFINLNNNLSVTQFQSIALHPTDPNIAFGGTQDNGTNLYNGSQVWQSVDDSDGGFCAVDQDSPNFVYHTFFNFPGIIIGPVRSKNGGQLRSWQLVNEGINQGDAVLFYAPFILDPNNQSTIYFGTSRLYRSTNQGDSWTLIANDLTGGVRASAVSAIAVAPSDSKTIYTGSSSGIVFASRDSGASFQNVTDNLPARYVSDVVVDPIRPSVVYVSLSGFGAGHVFKSENGGGRWSDLSGNLPDAPANALAMNPLNPNNLFLGTDIGLFRTDDGGATWELMPGMPKAAVFDIAINANLGIVRAATHGRGVYEAKIPKGPFGISISPASQTVSAGGSAGFTVEAFGVRGFSSQINLSASVSPSDGSIITSFSGTTIAPGSSAMLNAGASASALPAAFTITVSGASGDTVRTATVTVNVVSPDYALAFNPAQTTAARGQKGKFTVNISRSGGFAGNVTVTAPDTKALKIKIKQPSLSTTGGSLSFDFTVKKKAPLGIQQLVFTGRDDAGRVRTATLTLTIQ